MNKIDWRFEFIYWLTLLPMARIEVFALNKIGIHGNIFILIGAVHGLVWYSALKYLMRIRRKAVSWLEARAAR